MTGATVDQRMLSIAVVQHGAITSAQVRAIGATYDQQRRRVRSGRLSRIRPGLYVVAGFPETWHQKLWLEHLAAGPASAVNLESAAALHRLRRYRPGSVHVQRVQGGNHRPVHGSVHETFWMPPEHIVLIDRLPTTSVARTVFDLAGAPRSPWAFQNEVLRANHVKEITWLVNHAIRDHGMRMLDLDRVLASTGRRGKPGTAIIREVVADLGIDYAPTATELEELFLEFCDAFGIPRPDEQIDLGVEDRWVGRVDCVWRRARLIVEVDGKQHAAPLDRRADRVRDDTFGSVGLTVIRVTRWQLVNEPEIHAARIRQALALAA